MAGGIPLTKDPGSDSVWLDVDLGEGWRCRYRLAWDRRAVVAGMDVYPVQLPGGLTGRQLRKLRVTLPWELHPELDAAVAEALDVERPKAMRFGLDALDPDSEPLRPGRAGRSDLFIATVAARYAGLVEDGNRRPLATLVAELAARRFNFHESTVRGFIVTARQRGLLTPPDGPGAAGGDLTPAAVEILEEAVHEELQKAPVWNRTNRDGGRQP